MKPTAKAGASRRAMQRTLRYADASALLRILLAQEGERMPLGNATILTASICEVEIARAIERLRLQDTGNDQSIAQLYQDAGRLLQQVDIVATEQAVIRSAAQPFGVNIRALDALHVASAQVAAASGHALEFWTHDARQAVAAKARGLSVFGERT